MNLISIINGVSKSVSLGRNFLLSRPFNISFDVTHSCNLACVGCDFPLHSKQESEKDPSLQTIEERIRVMHDVFGSMFVTLADFEPTMREDLDNIIRSASKHNYVGIITNGRSINRKLALDYWNNGLFLASVSIPSFNDKRFEEIIGTDGYSLEKAKKVVEILLETSLGFGRVAIAATIDNETTLEELGRLARYTRDVGAWLSFQIYSPSKSASVDSKYAKNDKRTISTFTLENKFDGSLSGKIKHFKRKYPISDWDSAIDNFDTFIKEGVIWVKPRSFKVYIDGGVALYPEGEIFSNTDDREPLQILDDYNAYVRRLMVNGLLSVDSCYRCVNLTGSPVQLRDLLSILK